MDLKDFQNVQHDDDVVDNVVSATDTAVDTAKNIISKAKDVKKKGEKKVEQLVDSEFHDESDKIIKDLEARIAALNNDTKKVETSEKHHEVKTDSHEAENADIYQGGSADEVMTEGDDTETVVVQEGEGETFLDKIKPFILPIFLTIFALLFAVIFMYFFSKGKVERSAQAIVNNQAQPEVIIIKEEKPKEVVVVPEKVVPECDEETQILNEEKNECEDLPPPPPPAKSGFENGTTTVVKVRFSYDKLNYDTYPRGIYMLSEQIFGEEGEYEDYKILSPNRPAANDLFFGIDRYMVSLLGACQYVVDEADILVSDMHDSEGDQVYSAIKDKYFRGKVEKIIESSKPHIVCGK